MGVGRRLKVTIKQFFIHKNTRCRIYAGGEKSGVPGSTGPLTLIFQTQFHTLLPHSLAPLGGNLHTATPNNSRSGFQNAGLKVYKRRRSQPGNKLAKESFSNFHKAGILH